MNPIRRRNMCPAPLPSGRLNALLVIAVMLAGCFGKDLLPEAAFDGAATGGAGAAGGIAAVGGATGGSVGTSSTGGTGSVIGGGTSQGGGASGG
jgi:hypothetical protein